MLGLLYLSQKDTRKIAFTLRVWSSKMAVGAPAFVLNGFNARPIFKALFLLWVKNPRNIPFEIFGIN